MNLDPIAIREARQCPYCGGWTRTIDSALIYNGQGFGWVVACAKWPACQAWVGCHRGTTNPLGRLADYELRKAKMEAHSWCDRLWKKKYRMQQAEAHRRRTEAYAWLAKAMGLRVKECHIGWFDIEKYREVVRLCKERARAKVPQGAI